MTISCVVRCGKVKARGSGSSDKTTESLFSLNLHLFEMFGSFLARKKRGRHYAGNLLIWLHTSFCNLTYWLGVWFQGASRSRYRCTWDSPSHLQGSIEELVRPFILLLFDSQLCIQILISTKEKKGVSCVFVLLRQFTCVVLFLTWELFILCPEVWKSNVYVQYSSFTYTHVLLS